MSPTRRAPARSTAGPRRATPPRGDGEHRAGGLRVGVLRRRGKFVVAEPFFEAGPRVAVSRDGRAAVGDLVAVRTRPHRDGRGGRAVIASRLGRPEIARDVIEAFMIDRGLKRSFSDSVERAATATVTPDSDRRPRRDLRSLETFTIDPVSARDFDDAISVAPAEDGGRRVWVHIADVSAHVAPGSPLDREAYRRGCSVYVPGAVEPMLPAALSSGACSLVPDQDRLAFTVELLVRDAGVHTAAFYRSVISSDARLDYGQVDSIFAGTERAPERCGEALLAARQVAAALQGRREQRGALAISSEEPEFRFDRDGNVVEAVATVQT